MAMSGALVGSKCYASQVEGMDAYYSATVPATTSGNPSYVTGFLQVSGVWKVQRYSVDNTGVVSSLSISNAPVVSFPACDPAEHFNDGVVVGWGIAAAMIAAAAFKMMQRAM